MKTAKIIQWLGLAVVLSVLTGCYTTFRSVSYANAGGYSTHTEYISETDYDGGMVETAYAEPETDREVVVLQFRPSRLVVQKTYFNYTGPYRKVYYVAEDPWFRDEPVFWYDEPDIFIHIGFGSTYFVPDPFDFWWASPVYYPVIPVVPVLPYYPWYPVVTTPIWYPPVCWDPPVLKTPPKIPFGKRDWDRRRLVTHRPERRISQRDLQRPDRRDQRRITRPNRATQTVHSSSGQRVGRRSPQKAAPSSKIQRIRQNTSVTHRGGDIRTTDRRQVVQERQSSDRNRTRYQRGATDHQKSTAVKRHSGNRRSGTFRGKADAKGRNVSGYSTQKNSARKQSGSALNRQDKKRSHTSPRIYYYQQRRGNSGNRHETVATPNYHRNSTTAKKSVQTKQRQSTSGKSYNSSGHSAQTKSSSYRQSSSTRSVKKPSGNTSGRKKSSNGSRSRGRR